MRSKDEGSEYNVNLKETSLYRDFSGLKLEIKI